MCTPAMMLQSIDEGVAVVTTVMPETVHCTGAELGEGPSWSPLDDALLWVDLHAGVVHRLELNTGFHTRHLVGQPVSAVVLRRGGGLLLTVRDGIAEVHALGSTPRLVKAIDPGRPVNRCNDAICDSKGRLWVGTMADDCSPRQGAVHRYDLDGALTTMISGTTIANGIAWSPADDAMYFIDSATRRIDRFAWDPQGGTIRRRSVLADTTEWPGIPDGLAVDADGGLWVAFFGGGSVRRFTPSGRLDAVVELPVTQVTSCAFGAPGLDTLFITTARRGLNAQQRREQPLAGSVFACHVPTPGLPVHPFGSSAPPVTTGEEPVT